METEGGRRGSPTEKRARGRVTVKGTKDEQEEERSGEVRRGQSRDQSSKVKRKVGPLRIWWSRT